MPQKPEIDIDDVCRLARLELSGGEREAYSKQLTQILEYFEMIRSVDVSDVRTPKFSIPLDNVLRDDEPGEPFPRETALRCAPAQRDGQFVVPKVVEDA